MALITSDSGAVRRPWLTAAILMENPYCSCELTRVRPSPPRGLAQFVITVVLTIYLNSKQQGPDRPTVGDGRCLH